VCISNAIVRNCVANSTINEIITNRAIIRNALKREISELVGGWGVWVETIEITDVKILSESLFKNMQSKFREDQKHKAEMERLYFQDQIENERLKSQLEMEKRQNDSNKVQTIYKAQKELEEKESNTKLYMQQKQLELFK